MKSNPCNRLLVSYYLHVIVYLHIIHIERCMPTSSGIMSLEVLHVTLAQVNSLKPNLICTYVCFWNLLIRNLLRDNYYFFTFKTSIIQINILTIYGCQWLIGNYLDSVLLCSSLYVLHNTQCIVDIYMSNIWTFRCVYNVNRIK